MGSTPVSYTKTFTAQVSGSKKARFIKIKVVVLKIARISGNARFPNDLRKLRPFVNSVFSGFLCRWVTL